MDPQQIFVLVGKQIREATASRITASGVAIVNSDHGILEFSKWFESRKLAQREVNRVLRKKNRASA